MLTKEYSSAPSLIPTSLVGFGLIIDITYYITHKDTFSVLGLISFYLIPMLGFLFILYTFTYLSKLFVFLRSMLDINRPDVRITRAHADLAHSIVTMNPGQRDHHMEVIKQLSLPFKIGPFDKLITLDGMEISGRTLLHYINGLRDDGYIEETDQDGKIIKTPTYEMKPEREADNEDREGIRQIADELEKTYAVSPAKGNKAVTVTANGLKRYLIDLLIHNGRLTPEAK